MATARAGCVVIFRYSNTRPLKVPRSGKPKTAFLVALKDIVDMGIVSKQDVFGALGHTPVKDRIRI